MQNESYIKIGLDKTGFIHPKTKTLLNVKGKLIFKGKFAISRGCSFDIGENACVEIGDGGYINGNTNIIIMHELKIGRQCAISWNCQFLDEDFHSIYYEGKKEKKSGIIIGDKVWIGCNVKLYKGTKIADNCVIAADSVVRGCFDETNCLIAGNPAKIIKRNVTWE
ncbi:acetyltransferase-like isoleucine patch superfamily enzyme [Breznakibacter xylanolyticus]|uniref:Acetyltransferase-like isoleucine patch superfamily enzyme n=1 Tax=Breznakibacter xylanolyticus TaxID=990 RepID=A0A2W7NG10_9BACT|nr:acyltransferase [Breznakibacter xylanolyticus]PZX19158.1 acetyltransferase-like isoleucine patch superfamily enzyme [Breznakibacter xylanolyticus]